MVLDFSAGLSKVQQTSILKTLTFDYIQTILHTELNLFHQVWKLNFGNYNHNNTQEKDRLYLTNNKTFPGTSENKKPKLIYHKAHAGKWVTKNK